VAGGWLNHNNEKVRDFYSSSIIVQVIKSRRIGMGGGHFARVGEKCMQGLVVKPRGKKHLENIGLDGRIMSLELRWEGVDWIYLAQDRGLIQETGSCEQGMNLGFHQIRRICWLTEEPLASQERLCSVELSYKT